jgi:hypothetical protein
MIFCGWPLRSSIVNLSLPRTPSRECQSSIRIGSAGAATGAGAWAHAFSALGEMNRRNGASIAVSPGSGLCGFAVVGLKAGEIFDGTSPNRAALDDSLNPVLSRASTIAV